MAYTAIEHVKDIVGSGNIPSEISDDNIWRMINRADKFIDGKTQTTHSSSYSDGAEDSGVNAAVEGASALIASSFLLKAIANQALMGVKYGRGPVSRDNASRQMQLNAQAKQNKMEGIEILEDGGFIDLLTIRKANE